jgi:polyisoprenoid-binding protein YceI
MKNPTLALLALSAFAAGAAAAAGYVRTAEPAQVVFQGKGPGGLKIEGKTGAVTVTEGEKTLTVEVTLKDLTTGIALRDRHMRDKYLEVEKFPTTKLEVDKAALQFPAPGGSVSGEAKGMYSLHGKQKELPFKYKASCNTASVCNVTGNIAMNINDFGITIPVYLGVTMKPDVTVDISFQAEKK